MKKIFSVGNICLFVAALVLTFGIALIVDICGGESIDSFMSGSFAGLIGTMAFGAIAGACGYKLPEGPEAGIVGTLVGMFLVFLFI